MAAAGVARGVPPAPLFSRRRDARGTSFPQAGRKRDFSPWLLFMRTTIAAAVTSAATSIAFPADQIDDDGDDDRQKRRANEKIAPVHAKPFH